MAKVFFTPSAHLYIFIMVAGLFRLQISSSIRLRAPTAQQHLSSLLSRALMLQVGSQGMEEYTFPLPRIEEFLTAKLAKVKQKKNVPDAPAHMTSHFADS